MFIVPELHEGDPPFSGGAVRKTNKGKNSSNNERLNVDVEPFLFISLLYIIVLYIFWGFDISLCISARAYIVSL